MVREQVRKMGWDRCVVVNKERVVLGLPREKGLSSDPNALVEEEMRNGPATFLPNEPVRWAGRWRSACGIVRRQLSW